MSATTWFPLPGMVFDDVYRGWHYPDTCGLRVDGLFSRIELPPLPLYTWVTVSVPVPKRKRHKKRGKRP